VQVVFRGGEGALQVLPPLVDVIPEARLNLVIYYLRQGKRNLSCSDMLKKYFRIFIMTELVVYIVNT
jgi:hypothetical protein